MAAAAATLRDYPENKIRQAKQMSDDELEDKHSHTPKHLEKGVFFCSAAMDTRI